MFAVDNAVVLVVASAAALYGEAFVVASVGPSLTFAFVLVGAYDLNKA